MQIKTLCSLVEPSLIKSVGGLRTCNSLQKYNFLECNYRYRSDLGDPA